MISYFVKPDALDGSLRWPLPHQHGIYHVEAPTPKHVENSLRGVEYAFKHHFKKIDIDLSISYNGTVYGNHWPLPCVHDGFRDPLRKIPHSKQFRFLTDEQIDRLVAGVAVRYHIIRLESLLKRCAERRVIALLEPKGDNRFNNVAIWREIRKMADKYGTVVQVRALPDASSALMPARAAFHDRPGFKAWQIGV
jgi:hypothetical protein